VHPGRPASLTALCLHVKPVDPVDVFDALRQLALYWLALNRPAGP
jgi:hypothetical protein